MDPPSGARSRHHQRSKRLSDTEVAPNETRPIRPQIEPAAMASTPLLVSGDRATDAAIEFEYLHLQSGTGFGATDVSIKLRPLQNKLFYTFATSDPISSESI